jgi:uncharacterized SAM-dependent methyltransferase
MEHNIFISYSWDNAITRAAVVNELKNLQGIKLIYDKIDIPKGDPIHPIISNLMKETDLIIPILTEESIKSLEVLDELSRGSERKINFFPLIEDKISNKDLPHFLKDINYIKYNKENIDEKLNVLKNEIEKKFNIEYETTLEVPEPFSYTDGRIGRIIEDARINAWTLSVIGEDEAEKQRDLIGYLSGTLDENGEKKIVSGFSYWGIGPTSKWINACNDINYIMKSSIDNFDNIWKPIFNTIPKKAYNYVSLGVGTGKKDSIILNRLCRINPMMFYLPVDISPEMLRAGVNEVRGRVDKRNKKLCETTLLPIQTDFSKKSRIDDLKFLIDKLIPDKPIIYGLLGNTISNFDNDSDTLRDISILLNPGDLLLLEITRAPQINKAVVNKARFEYTQKAFRDFALSSLLQNTDLEINEKQFKLITEEEMINDGQNNILKALKILSYYENDGINDKTIRLPNWGTVEFPKNDRIRIYLSRKYTKEGINHLIESSGFEIFKKQKSEYLNQDVKVGFELLLLKKKE